MKDRNTPKDAISRGIRIVDSKPIGVKYDKGKRQWSLLPFGELEDILEILEFGAKKYSVDNWKRVEDSPNRYFDALMRHLLEYKKGFDNGILDTKDEESGKSSLAHAGCCLLFLMWHAKQNEKLKSDKVLDAIIDDAFKRRE